jgi:hypothetical protein
VIIGPGPPSRERTEPDYRDHLEGITISHDPNPRPVPASKIIDTLPGHT